MMQFFYAESDGDVHLVWKLLFIMKKYSQSYIYEIDTTSAPLKELIGTVNQPDVSLYCDQALAVGKSR